MGEKRSQLRKGKSGVLKEREEEPVEEEELVEEEKGRNFKGINWK